MLPDQTLAGKVAVITGGGTGLGRAMARKLSSLGAAVVLASRKIEHLTPTVEEIEQAGGRAAAVPTDVRDPEQVDRLVAETERLLGPADILVNNAAGNFVCRAEDLSPNGWRAVVDIVLNGTFFCSRAFGRAMIKHGKGGAMLNILATYAWTGGPGTIHSASAKAGVMAMTQTLAVEWARHRIRVNAIAPGAIPTEGAWSALLSIPGAEQVARARVPLGRFGTQDELANLAAFLVSDYAGYITGDVITMDGGSWLGRGFLQFHEEAAAGRP